MGYHLTRDAPTLWRMLNGLVCVYKPSGISEKAVQISLSIKLCRELNEMDCRPPVNYVSIEGNTTKEMQVTVTPSYADDPLVVGPRYQKRDLRFRSAVALGVRTSGVYLLGLNDGVHKVCALDYASQLRTFHVHGQLGRATDTLFTDGMVTERSKFQHVTQQRIDKYLASVQAAHQKSMFELSGIDIQSQDAYELAVQGLIRPADPHVPMIYGIKCVEFKPPDFTLEVHCTNETEIYLMNLINELGFKMHSNAVCTKLRCVRHSYFTVHNALLRKHWTLQYVLDNLQENDKILKANPDFFSGLLKPATLLDPRPKQPLIA